MTPAQSATVLALLATPALAEDATVVRVVDADTLVVEITVRLADVDAPETMAANACGGEDEIALGRAAQEAVDALLASEGYEVTLSGIRPSEDPYGRLVADVAVAGMDLGDWLLDQGLAREWPSGPEPWCP